MRYLFLVLLLFGCNPVKQVLRDQDKLEQVAKVVIAGGWCANDTTFIVKSDTLVVIDTLIHNDIETYTEIINDTAFITKWKTRDIIKSTIIHDTLKSYIVDNARVRLLQADSSRLSYELNDWERKAKKRQFWIFFLLGIFALYLYLKSKI